MNILDELAAAARQRVARAEKAVPLGEIKARALSLKEGDFGFERALRGPGLSFICEVKRASPSKGLIAPEFPYLDIAREYEAAGAEAISVLTEPTRFLGELRYLEEIAGTVKTPCLRKDFTVSEYMIYEARLAGASAVLLICSILTPEEIKAYISLCDRLGLSALVEAHDEREVKTALDCRARIVGVNNRNLRDFTVDTANSARLRDLVPPEVIFVSESGVRTRGDVEGIISMGADAALVGEALMRAPDKAAKMRELRGEA